MRIFSILLGLLLATIATNAADSSSALSALKVIPKAQAKLLARIEARDGKPTPERWHFLVHDKSAENGLREFVVAAGEVVASRGLSQFSEGLSAQDVVGADAVKIDSDRAAKLVNDYALANHFAVSTLQYVMKKEGAEAAPLWHVTACDDTGKELGVLVIAAGKGIVVSHDGFAVEPKPTPTEAFQTQQPTQTGGPNSNEPVAQRRTSDDPDEPRKPGLFRHVGGKFQRFFTGKDTLSR